MSEDTKCRKEYVNYMRGLCGADCESCGYGKSSRCKGCTESCCAPFGKPCFVAAYIKTGGREAYDEFVRVLIDEINALGVPGMSKVTELFPMNGEYVNLAYPLPGGGVAQFLDDNEIYLAMQVESEFDDGTADKCFGIVANADFILVAAYGENGSDPELVLYKKR